MRAFPGEARGTLCETSARELHERESEDVLGPIPYARTNNVSPSVATVRLALNLCMSPGIAVEERRERDPSERAKLLSHEV